jgi:hypothetical protein
MDFASAEAWRPHSGKLRPLADYQNCNCLPGVQSPLWGARQIERFSIAETVNTWNPLQNGTVLLYFPIRNSRERWRPEFSGSAK